MWSERFNKEFKEESKKETNEKSKNELKKELFGEDFYEEMEPEKRLEIFQKNIDSDNNKELRECLWTARYGKRKPKKDLFIGYLMEMKYISESGSTDVGGAKRKQLCKIINNLCIDNYEILSEEQRGILKNELKNTFKKFIQVSRGGRGFTSAVFGLGQLSDEGIAKKIAEQIRNIAFLTPHMFRMDKEFKILQAAALEAYREEYPNREHFLKK